MKNEILAHLDDPKQLERLYRTNKLPFRREFQTIYPEIKGHQLADFWNERLNYESEDVSWGSTKELVFMMVAALVAGCIAKLPAITGIDKEFFYTRNIGFILFPALSAFFAWKNQLSVTKTAFIVATMLIGLVFINTLPTNQKSDTLVLSCIHLLLFLWCIFGFAFTGGGENF
ncbi:MAG TPA: hypothetical protein VFL47_14390, partial [Flavisolibacter sp.]|nr:hypothetical protein [Flavisolibacter sp.]